jgi:hypothetical protein
MADDTQNSTAVAPAPDQQSSITPDTTTNPPAPTPTQQPDGADTQAGSLTALTPGPQDPNATTPGPLASLTPGGPQTQDAPDQYVPSTLPQPTNAPPKVATPAAAPAAPLTFTQKLLKTSSEIFKAMGGGDQYTTTFDANGVPTRTPAKMDKTHLGLAIALEALSGGLAGAGAHGTAATGEAAGAGLQEGEKIGAARNAQQEQADQKAQQDYVRKFETTKANLQMFDTMQAVGKHSYDIANGPVTAMASYMEYWTQHDPDKIIDPDVDEKTALAVSNNPLYHAFRVPTQTIPKLDSNGNQIYTDHAGMPVKQGTPGSTPAWDHRFALVHRDADVRLKGDDGQLTPAAQAQIDQGRLDPSMKNAASDATVPAGGQITSTAQVQTANAMKEYLYGEHGVLATANQYRARRDAQNGSAPNVYDPAKDSIYDVFGGNISHLSDFIQTHASPQAIKDNNFAMIPAGADWTGQVDNTGPVPLRVYPDKASGQKATDEYLVDRQQNNPKESISSFIKDVTRLGGGGAVSNIQPVVQEQAKQTGVDPNILNALIAKESSFRPGANGSDTEASSTAKGLMQVNDPTAKAYGLDPAQMHDPEYNIRAGAKILQDKIKQAGGDVRKGLMNYYGSSDQKKNAAYADDILQRADSYQKDPNILQQYEGDQGNQNIAGYTTSVFRENGATNINDASDQAKPVADFNGEIAKDPMLADSAFLSFNRALKNDPTANPAIAISKMRSTREAAFMTRLMGGPDVAADYNTMRQINKTGVTEAVKNDAKLAFETAKRANEQKDIIKRNENLINDMATGGAIDPTSIATMRASDRETIFNEVLRRNPQYNLAAVRNMIDLTKEITEKYTAGSFGNQVGNIQTAYNHAGAAHDDLQLLRTMLPSGDISPYINMPTKEVLQSLRSVNPKAADAFVRYQIDLHTATTDWQNLINNGHALHETDKEVADNVIQDTTPFGTADAALKGLMANAGKRIDPLNQRYQMTFSQGTGKKVNYPNLIEPNTLETIRKMNDPEVMQQVAHYETGGTMYGGRTGISSPGKEVGLLLTPAAPQAGQSVPTKEIVQQYRNVYGFSNAHNPDILRAMQANGWKVK